jgi:hypothetical protein
MWSLDEIANEGGLEVGQAVASGGRLQHAELVRADPERLEQPGELAIGDRLAVAVIAPRALRETVKLLQDGGRDDLRAVDVLEDSPEVSQEQDSLLRVRILIGAPTEDDGGRPGPLRPVAPGRIGDGEQGAPVVGLPVSQPIGYQRIGGPQGFQVGAGPAGEGFTRGLELVEACLAAGGGASRPWGAAAS